MSSRRALKFLILFSFLSAPLRANVRRVIVLRDSIGTYKVSRSVEVLRDPTGVLTVDSVTFGRASRQFVKSSRYRNNFGFTREAIWVRLTVENGAAANLDWFIGEDYSIIDTVCLYVPSSDGKFRAMIAGTAYPMNVRAVPSRQIVFPLHLKPLELETVYLRFHSSSDLPVDLRIWKPSAFYEREAHWDLLFGIFYGGLLIMAFYNLFLYFSIRDLSYLYYSLYALFIGYYQFCMDGFRYEFLFPNTVAFVNLDVNSAVSLMGIFWLLFVKEFLQISKYSRRLENVYRILIAVFTLELVLALFVPGPLIYMVCTLLWAGPVFLNIGAGVYCLKRGNVNARIFLIATVIFLIGVSLRGFRMIGYQQVSWINGSALQVGVLLEMTILSFALGNRINSLRQAHEEEKAMVRSRIASDLHDEIGSNLSSISVASQMIQKNAYLQEAHRRLIEDITVAAKETAESMREIVWFVNPEHDRAEDLVLKMHETAARMLQGIDFSFESGESKFISRQDLQFRRNLFLIFKEVLNNVVKHSGATRVIINLDEKAGRFCLEITDNGVGFEERTVSLFAGNGIKNLRKRSAEIGCRLKISTSPGRGTAVLLTMKEG